MTHSVGDQLASIRAECECGRYLHDLGGALAHTTAFACCTDPLTGATDLLCEGDPVTGHSAGCPVKRPLPCAHCDRPAAPGVACARDRNRCCGCCWPEYDRDDDDLLDFDFTEGLM